MLLAVSRAWEALDPEMRRIEAKMAALRALAAELHPTGRAPSPATAEGRRRAGRGRGRARAAPRAAWPRIRSARRAAVDADRAAPHRARARASIARPRRAPACSPGSTHARELSRGLDEAHDRALPAPPPRRGARSRARPSARLPPVLDEGLLAGLDEWLRKLEGTVEARRWSPAEVGLTRWRAAAEQYAGDRRLRAPPRPRRSWPSRPSSPAASRRVARRPRRSPRAGSRSILRSRRRAREAEALLRRRPVPIDEAARAVEAYEAAVIALGAKRHG